MNFCNEYTFNEKSIYETVNAWYKHKLTEPKSWKLYIILVLLMSVALLLLAFETINFFAICFSLILSILTVGITIVLSVKIGTKKSVKAQVERLKILYQNEIPNTIIILNDIGINYTAPGIDKNIQYNDISQVIHSNNFIILLLKGNMTLSLKKDGFTKGTANECINFLNNITKK